METGTEGQSWLQMFQNIQWWVLLVALKLWDFLLIHTSNFFYYNATFTLSAPFLDFQVT